MGLFVYGGESVRACECAAPAAFVQHSTPVIHLRLMSDLLPTLPLLLLLLTKAKEPLLSLL